jgi:arylsulfatase A-like enzyme
MKRLSILRSVGVMGLLLVSAAGRLPAEAPRSDSSAPRPNVVFIMADDLGWGDVAFHDGAVPTPHLDRLREEGMELTRHYVAPVCTPTRTGLLTGRVWSRFGVTTPNNERALPWETFTLPRALEQAGYRTALIGKWHLGSLPEWGPDRFGFQHAYGSLAGGVSPWSHGYKEGPFTRTWHRNGALIEEAGHVTELLTNEAIDWLRQQGSQPFFLYLPYTAVHLPIREPQAWLDRVPETIQGEVARHYAASVMHLDHSVGRVLTALELMGLEERTLVVFTSDNGGSTAENNDTRYPDDGCPSGALTGSNLPWRGEKGELFEGGIRVPTLVRWPNRIPAGSQNDQLSQITDWMPTICGLAGVSVPDHAAWDGIDLTPVLRDGAATAIEREVYSVGPRWFSKSLHAGPWKLLISASDQVTSAAYDQLRLYHLEHDPGERDDRSAAEPQVVARMLERMARFEQSDRDSLP